MLIKNSNFWLNTMLIIAFFPKQESIEIHALTEKLGQFNNFLCFRATFGKILRVMVSDKICEVRYTCYFQFFISEFLWENA